VERIRSRDHGCDRTSVITKDDFLIEVRASLGGPRRRRKRLVEELAGHIDDAMRAELAANPTFVDAERIVLERLGNAGAIADRWRADRRKLRARRQRRLAAATFALVAAAALGITQYAAGKPQPARRDPPAQTTPTPRGKCSEEALTPRRSSIARPWEWSSRSGCTERKAVSGVTGEDL
jgi:hypothetical protein